MVTYDCRTPCGAIVLEKLTDRPKTANAHSVQVNWLRTEKSGDIATIEYCCQHHRNASRQYQTKVVLPPIPRYIDCLFYVFNV